jgi:hypothetical protein
VSTTQEVNEATEAAGRSPRAFLLGCVVAGLLVWALYHWMVLPGRDAQMSASEERIKLLTERLATASAASPAATNVAAPYIIGTCVWTTVSQGGFSSTSGDHKAGGWAPDDATVDTLSESAPHTRFASITSSSIIQGTARPTKYEMVVAGALRNPQFPRIELKVPTPWYGREMRMQAALRWKNLRLVPTGYPGVVAVNIIYRAGGETRDRFIVLFGEHFPNQGWDQPELPSFRLPLDTTSATIRVGLHGVFGTLDIDNVVFQQCK